jgi:riboflavin transporter FmnP
MQHTKLIKADAAINLILGVLLMTFPAKLIKVLGIPMADLSFYPAILGGVLFGIGLALLVECYRRTNRFIGLGLAGAVLINLCGGFVLAFWLLWGQLNLPVRGLIFLWTLVVLLIGLSLLEGLAHLKKIE